MEHWYEHVYLRGKGFENFTGVLGQLTFTGGKSDRPVSEGDITPIAANQRVVRIDEAGTETVVGETAMSATQSRFDKQALKTRQEENESRKKRKSTGGTEEQVGRNQDGQRDASAVSTPHGRQPSERSERGSTSNSQEHTHLQNVKTYTESELVAIADAKGLAGLREIGDQIDVKAKTIETMIDRIVKKQEKQAKES